MTIIPAIDIFDGRCVRLREGSYAEKTEYTGDPADVARSFLDAGATRVHIVDLNAARGDAKTNRSVIRKIRGAAPCLLEIGGGVRTLDDIRELLDIGLDRLVVGTVFAKNPDTVAEWANEFGNVFIAGIDARDGTVRVSGWTDDSGVRASDLAQRAAEYGVCSVVYTNIAHDGVMKGPDVAGTNEIAEVSSVPVILSGGIGTLDDLRTAAATAHKDVVGVIVGRAIYEGTVTPKEAFAAFPQPDPKEMAW
ncbi:MAG: 1-(5-phosphoribosyl)-5-[(5-phosphoribosylamino)methylideneamino]imidazole-4-carboxamide isomerase [Spirochaetaceae bacterium]|nr:MAG: 1-(5-phosphoribosyl)-5-[(5-phosphoribosylamino)methylideneamino]imidazole-4-carboxamide isomerase [Spirochaetaceae bacterium]